MYLILAQVSVGSPPIYRFFTLLLLATLFSIRINADSDSRKNNPSLIGRFWEIGCEFSGVVSRVRRSAPNPPPEEPNFDDPEELFNYLYPLADVKPGDDHIGSQRSTHGTHSLSSWLEDLMELWHSECLHRRKKRSAERREEYKSKGETWSTKTHRIRGRVDRTRPASTEGGRNSSLEQSLSKMMSGRREDNRDGGDINSYQNYDGQGNANGELEYGHDGTMDNTSNDDNYEDEYRKGIFDKDKDKDKKPSTTAAPKPPPPPPPAPVEDIFFSQYGGDIEYFFPLLSFGIPFDGEITLLGFHGFHGLFPY